MSQPPGATLAYFNDGGGGLSDFLGLKFWPKVIFLGRENKTEGFFWVAKKELQ